MLFNNSIPFGNAFYCVNGICTALYQTVFIVNFRRRKIVPLMRSKRVALSRWFDVHAIEQRTKFSVNCQWRCYCTSCRNVPWLCCEKLFLPNSSNERSWLGVVWTNIYCCALGYVWSIDNKRSDFSNLFMTMKKVCSAVSAWNASNYHKKLSKSLEIRKLCDESATMWWECYYGTACSKQLWTILNS